jgi:hypothetical protein
MPAFDRTIGIDYSGAETPTASLKGLRVYLAEGDGYPVEVPSPPSPREYWTRKGIAQWLMERLAEDTPTLVGKRVLGGATSVVEGLGSLRNKIGDAHGQGGKPVRPTARRAQLAVNLAGAMATFLVDTWAAKQS